MAHEFKANWNRQTNRLEGLRIESGFASDYKVSKYVAVVIVCTL